MNWIKVYYASDEIDAKMVEGLLKSEGIKVQIIPRSDGNIIKSPLFHTHSNIPYEILVPENEKIKAEDILKSSEKF